MQICSTSALAQHRNSSPCRTGSTRHRSDGPSQRLLLSLFVLLVGAVLLFVPRATAQQSPSPLQTSDLLNVQEIREVTLSPSGRNVAYTVRHAASRSDAPATDRTRLYVAPAYGRDSPRLLTRSGHDVSQPAWHPDGGQLAFVRPVAGTPQVFVLSLSGGEAYQLTDAPHGATDPKWSPEGDRLLFASPLPESEVERRTRARPPFARPGRSPRDTIRRVPPDTILVLREAGTLDPADTLAYGPDGTIRLPTDTSRALRSPGGPSVPDSLRSLPVDSLRTLSPDSLRTVLEKIRLLPDTTLVPVAPDTAASPDGDLLQTRRWLDQHRRGANAQVFTRLDPRGKHGLNPTSTYRHYFLVDVPDNIQGEDPPRPTPRPVTQGYRSYHGATWMPGGTQVVVSAPAERTEAPTRLQDRNLYVVDLRPSRIHQLLDIDGYALTRPRVTTDGTTIAFRAQDRSTRSYAHAEIGLFELDGRSDPQLITANFDHDISSLRWSPDGWYLYATAPTSVGRPLYRFAPFAQTDTSATGRRTSLADDYATSRDTFALDSSMVRTAAYKQVLDEARTVQDYDVTDSKAIYAVADLANPSELYTNTISFNNERRLTSHNANWVAARSLAPARRFTVQSGDVSVEARLTRPLNRVDSLRYPLVVRPRGGPTALHARSPIPSWFDRHYLAGRGYAVLEVWPRGSDGYGETFRRRNFQNWGPGPASDVLAATDSVLARGWVNATQQVLSGRSYGGYLASWMIGHTDRFRAAVAESGVYDLSAFFGNGEVWPIIPEQFGGFPWESAAAPPPDLLIRPGPSPLLSAGLLPPMDTTMSPRAALQRNSPMTHAHRVETPLLLVHGGADVRTGASQAEMLYRRLHILDRPVEYVRYPGTGHNIWRTAPPRQRMDRLARLYEFLARYTTPGGRLPSSPPDPQ